MNSELETACAAIDGIGQSVLSSWGSDATYLEAFGWFAPAATRTDLCELARQLATDIRAAQPDQLDPQSMAFVSDLPRRLQALQSQTVPLFGGPNCGQAIFAYLTTLNLIRTKLLPSDTWRVISDPKALPPAVARRVRSAQAELDRLAPALENLSGKISEIHAAHQAAETLPIDLQSLNEARDSLARAYAEGRLTGERLKEAWGKSEEYLNKTRMNEEEATRLIAQCEAAYQITTTKGLAGSFDQRARRLGLSMIAWVVGLIVALFAGSFIGASRLNELSHALQVPTPHWGAVSIQIVLSLLSVGAPLWFAWLATKQIGQRFRLAEDYAFKASVAKAYEGYRKEAARIDPAFEHQLFGSALSRLEEAPLRLVETSSHGSPWHEAANSDAIRRAMDAMPDVRDKVVRLLQEIAGAVPNANIRRSKAGPKSEVTLPPESQ